MPIPTLTLVQAGTEITEALDLIVAAQITMAVAMVVIVLILLAAAVTGLVAARRMGAKVRAFEARLEPRVDPLLERATRISADVAEVTGRLRGDVEGVRLTLSEANLKLRELTGATEERVRRIGQLLDVVQEEAEDTLLDVASTARGVQAAARRLREEEPRAVRPHRDRARAELRIGSADRVEFDEP